jgi:hypothetical protein
MDQRVTALERALERHLGGCEEQNKAVNSTLSRLEKGVDGLYSRFWKIIFGVVAAQWGVLLLIFAAWLSFPRK